MKFKVVQEKLGDLPPEGCASALRVIVAFGGTVECPRGEYHNYQAGGNAIDERYVELLFDAGFLERVGLA